MLNKSTRKTQSMTQLCGNLKFLIKHESTKNVQIFSLSEGRVALNGPYHPEGDLFI